MFINYILLNINIYILNSNILYLCNNKYNIYKKIEIFFLY